MTLIPGRVNFIPPMKKYQNDSFFDEFFSSRLANCYRPVEVRPE